jgi:hypothetical protein
MFFIQTKIDEIIEKINFALNDFLIKKLILS